MNSIIRTQGPIGDLCVDVVVHLFVQRRFHREGLVEKLLVEILFRFRNHDTGYASVVKLLEGQVMRRAERRRREWREEEETGRALEW